MADNLQSAANSLAEQTRKFDIATYYTNGDAEKAKQMVAGAFKDQYAIKGRFTSSSVYGAFLVFFNPAVLAPMSVYTIITKSFAAEDIKTSADWKIFESEITTLLSAGEHDQVMCNHAREEITAGMTLDFNKDIKKLFEINDAITVNHRFKKLLETRLGFQQIKITIDFEPVSSLDMELFSTSSKKIDPRDMKEKLGQDQPDAEKKEEESKIKPGDPLAGKEVKLIMTGSLILSPIKGKDISLIQVGDRVKIKIVDKTSKAVQVAKAFNAYDEETGNMSAITGRVVSSKFDSKVGHEFFIIVAKGIFVKVIEEEDNIKVAVEDPDAAAGRKGSKETKESRLSAPLAILLVIVFMLLVGGVIFLVL